MTLKVTKIQVQVLTLTFGPVTLVSTLGLKKKKKKKVATDEVIAKFTRDDLGKKPGA